MEKNNKKSDTDTGTIKSVIIAIFIIITMLVLAKILN